MTTKTDIFPTTSFSYYSGNHSANALADWSYAIQTNYLKYISAIGLPGNLAAILTITSVKPLNSAAFLVTLLAASDSAALVVKLVINQVSFQTTSPYTSHFCRSQYLANVCSCYANWVLVMIAVERLVAVTFPINRSQFLSKHRIYCICLLLLLLVFAVHAPLIFSNLIVEPENPFQCKSGERPSVYVENVWPWLNIIVYAWLPILLLMFIATAVGMTLQRARQRRRSLQASVSDHSTPIVGRAVRRSQLGITSIMLAASLLFMLLVLPQCIYFILFEYTAVFSSLMGTPEANFTCQITTVLADSTHALNFYIYVLSVRRFRHRVCSRFLGGKTACVLCPRSLKGLDSSEVSLKTTSSPYKTRNTSSLNN